MCVASHAQHRAVNRGQLFDYKISNSESCCCIVWGAVRKNIYLRDLAQKLLSLRAFSYICTEIAISAHI